MIRSLVHREIVEAGAGCGKTTGLVARYIAALGQSHDTELRKKYASPDRPAAHASEILALTFTNEAAQQMQDRILRALHKQGSTLEARAVQEESQISTYHSFCLKLLQPHIHKLGYEGPLLSPLLASHLRKESLLRSLAAYPEAHKIRKAMSLPRLIELSLQYWFHPLNSDPSEAIAEAYKKYQNSFENFRQIELSQAQSLLAQLAVRDKKPKTDTWLHAYVKALEEPSTQAVQAIAARGLPWIKNEFPEFYERMRDFREFFKNQYFDAICPDAVEEEIHAQKELWKFLRWALPQSPKIFDFEAAEVEVFRLLQEAHQQDKRLIKAPRLILVDEFQDTNSRQYEILKFLSDNTTEWYFVGDPKQSIYAFRGGDVTLFYELREQLTRIDKDINYRSQPRILQYVNALQDQLFTPQHSPEDPPPQTLSWPSEKPDSSGLVQVSWLSPKESTLIRTRDWLLENKKHYEEASTAVLFRSWKKLYQFADLLREKNINFRIAGSENPFDHILSEIWAHTLLSLENPKYTEGLWALDRWQQGRGFDIAHIPQDATLIEKYTHSSTSWTAQFQKFCEYIQIERFENGAAWATAMERWLNERITEGFQAKLTLSNLAHWILKNQHSLEVENPYKHAPSHPDQASLTLLTLHASKGLEFKHVYLPELYERAPTRQQDAFETDEGDVLAQLDLRDNKGHKRKSLALQIEKNRKDRIKNAEEKRLLYVALTRAIESLHIVAHTPSEASQNKRDENAFSIIGEAPLERTYWHKALHQLGPIPSSQWIDSNNESSPEAEHSENENSSFVWNFPEDLQPQSYHEIFHRCGVSRYLKITAAPAEDEESTQQKYKSKAFDFASQDQIGTDFHKLLELWNGNIGQLDDLLKQFNPLFSDHLKEAALNIRALPELDTYWNDLALHPERVQKEFEMFLLSDQYRLSGFADAIWFCAHNEVVIIDWKSGRSLKRLQEPVRLEKFKSQLDLYAQGFSSHFSKIRTLVVGVELSENNRLAQVIYNSVFQN